MDTHTDSVENIISMCDLYSLHAVSGGGNV